MSKVSFLILFYLGVGATLPIQGQVNSTAHTGDREWAALTAPLWGVSSKDSAEIIWGPASARLTAWQELMNRQYRDRGAIFFRRYPDDDRFNEWLLKTCGTRQPHYWKEPLVYAENERDYLKNGTALISIIDDSAKRDWELQYVFFRAKYLSMEALEDQQRKEFLKSELAFEINDVNERLALDTGDLGKKMTAQLPVLLSYILNATDQNFLSRLLDISSHYPGMQETILSLMKVSRDSNERNIALQQEALYKRLREKPVELKLPVLGKPGQVIDLEKLRGKVVLVDAWNIHCGSCIAHMPKFERIYKQFHKDGFEMVALCVIGWDGRDKKKQEIARSIAIEKKYGLTYPSAELDMEYNPDGSMNIDNPVWNQFDGLAGGSFYLFDKEGKLVTLDGSGQWLEYEIRRLLGLKVEETGK